MSYEVIDVSVQDGSPVHLFEFVYEGITYRFTNVPGGYTALSNDWTEKPIRMGNVETTEEINKNNLDIEFPRNDDFGSLFLSEQQDQVTSLTLYRGYHNDPDADFATFWKGRVANVQVKTNVIKLVCESIFTSLKRPGLRGRYGKNCRHTVFNRGCNLDIDDATFFTDDIVSDISADGLTLTINAAASEADGFYRGGMVRSSDGVFRFITAHTGTQITISKTHDGLTSSDTVRIWPGCDRTPNTCLVKFSNLDNYGGFPYTTERNPFDGTRL